MQQVMQALRGWRCQAIVYQPLALVSPGIGVAAREQAVETIEIEQNPNLDEQLPSATSVVALGAVFEPFALDLFGWAKRRQLPVIAIQEVAQLALNQYDINNYDAPFDRLFVASPDERQRFIELGYPSQMLSVSGLLANERFNASTNGEHGMLKKLGAADGKKPIVYTTSPIRGRLALHNKDDRPFREAVLTEIAAASRRIGRKVVIKLHPNEEVEAAGEHIRKIIPDAIVIGREINMDQLFAATGILINRGNSQTCLDAVLRRVPTVVVSCGLKTLFHEDGGAYIVEELNKLCEVIEHADKEGFKDAAQVKAKHFFIPAEGVAGFIAKELSAIVQNRQPATEMTWNWLIKSMLFVGYHDRALQFCEKIESRSSWQECVRFALTAHREGRLQEAIERWQECSALNSNWFFPHYELAHGYHGLGDYQRAIEHAHKAIERHPPFHTLWHEIPMRVLIMASLRKMGDANGAARELNLLQARGLVVIVPELLIEKAAQLPAKKSQLKKAYNCLQKAFNQLRNYPVNEIVDAQLRERVLSQLYELGEKCERQKNYLVAERCYAHIVESCSNDTWAKFRLARATLTRGKLLTAFRVLHGMTKIRDVPKKVVDQALPPSEAARLVPFWPVTPRSILKPFKLAIFTFVWATGKFIRSDFQEKSNAATVLLLVAIFVVRHFFRRLSGESVRISGTLRKA